MTEVEKLEKTRVVMQQETSAAYLSALRVVGKLEAERDALRKLLDEVRPIVAETQTFDGHTVDTPSFLLARIDAARREA